MAARKSKGKVYLVGAGPGEVHFPFGFPCGHQDRKSTRLNSSHMSISYAVFCLKKKKNANRRASALKQHQPRHRPPHVEDTTDSARTPAQTYRAARHQDHARGPTRSHLDCPTIL